MGNLLQPVQCILEFTVGRVRYCKKASIVYRRLFVTMVKAMFGVAPSSLNICCSDLAQKQPKIRHY